MYVYKAECPGNYVQLLHTCLQFFLQMCTFLIVHTCGIFTSHDAGSFRTRNVSYRCRAGPYRWSAAGTEVSSPGPVILH